MRFRDVRFRSKLLLLIGLFVIGFSAVFVFGALTLARVEVTAKRFHEERVEGNLYQEIVLDKDLVIWPSGPSRLAEPEVAIEQGTFSVLVFRVGEEWMAADIALLVEIGEMRPIHTIPHRTNEILSGLVNIRG